MQQIVYGRLPHNPKTLALAPQFNMHLFGARQPLAVLDRRNVDVVPDVDENSVAPDCTAVQIANSIKVFSKLFAGYAYSTPQPEVLNLYAATVDCPPDLAAICQTQGAVFADIVGRVRTHGIQVADQLLAVPNVSVLDNSVAQLALATELYGCANIGIRLYERDEQQLSSDAMPTLDDDGSDKGLLQGRHMTMTWAHLGLGETDVWLVNFWGKWWPVTTRWLKARVDESWALMWRNLLSPDNVAKFPQMAAASQFVWL